MILAITFVLVKEKKNTTAQMKMMYSYVSLPNRTFFYAERNPVLKRFFTYILLVTLTLQSFYRSIMTVEYQLHLPDYLAKCINKDRPQLHCNGQCVLMKKIKEKEKKETEKNLMVYEYSALYVHAAYILFTPSLDMTVLDAPYSSYVVNYSFAYNNTVFHPPLS